MRSLSKLPRRVVCNQTWTKRFKKKIKKSLEKGMGCDGSLIGRSQKFHLQGKMKKKLEFLRYLQKLRENSRERVRQTSRQRSKIRLNFKGGGESPSGEFVSKIEEKLWAKKQKDPSPWAGPKGSLTTNTGGNPSSSLRDITREGEEMSCKQRKSGAGKNRLGMAPSHPGSSLT